MTANILAILIAPTKQDRQVQRLIPYLVDGGLSILKYVNDLIIFVEHNLEKVLNMKLILCILE